MAESNEAERILLLAEKVRMEGLLKAWDQFSLTEYRWQKDQVIEALRERAMKLAPMEP